MQKQSSKHRVREWLLKGLLVVVLMTMAFSTTTFSQISNTLTPAQKQIETQRQRLGSGNDEDRRDALMKLGAMRLTAASRASLPGLTDPSPMVRAVAASAILALPADESVSALLPLLADKDEFVRREVVYALGHTGSRKATAAVIERLVSDKEESVKAAAAVALGEIADESAVVPLAGLLAPEAGGVTRAKGKGEKNAFVLRAAAVALGAIHSRAGTAALVTALGNEKLDSDVRREAARALGRIGDPAGVDALQAATQSADPYLANIAREALKKVRS